MAQISDPVASAQELLSYLKRVEALAEEKDSLALDIKEVYGEAKATGFDVGILRKIVALRKKDPDKRNAEEQLLATYRQAIGMN